MKKPSLKDLTLREKIGQTATLRSNFIANIKDTDEYFKNNPYGSIWTIADSNLEIPNMADEFGDNKDFDRDIKNRLFIEHISKTMKVPFLAAMDAERGIRKVFPFFSETTSNTGLGSAGDTSMASKTAKAIAHEMKLCGVRWNWGPVADNVSPFCGASLTRCFSSDPKKITALTTEYIKAVQSENVAATIKHFPGADRDEYRDSHFSDYVINQSMDEWYARQGCIFEAAIKAGAWSVMVGHTVFPACDDTQINGRYVPATISKKIVTGLLKEKMGFKGVVVTDAVGMRSLTSMFTNAEDFYASLYNAGNDVILGPIHEDFIDIVEKAVLDGKISEQRIDDACQRVLDMKEKIGLFDSYTLEVSQEDREQAASNTHNLSKLCAEKSITWMSRKNNLVPLKKENIKNVQIVYIGYSKDALDNVKTYMKPEFEKRGANVSIVEQIKSDAHMEEIADNNDLIIYVAHIAPHSPYGGTVFVQEKATQFLHILRSGAEKSICISTGSPFVFHDWFPAAENFLNLYCVCPEFLQTFVAGIYGECEFSGNCSYDPSPLAPRL